MAAKAESDKKGIGVNKSRPVVVRRSSRIKKKKENGKKRNCVVPNDLLT